MQITGPDATDCLSASGSEHRAMDVMRLQKFLSAAGICSRRQAELFIRQGRVTVNGIVVTELGTKVAPDKDRVEFDAHPVEYHRQLIYIILNKPAGYVTSCRQPGDKLVLDLVDIPHRVYPVGRLDKDSTGLLLLTNDGRIHHGLSHPSFDHEKEYEVTVASPIPDSALSRMEKGMVILGRKTRAAVIKRMDARRFTIVLKEGRNRQIRRMVRKVDNQVVGLKRIRITGIRLGNLAEGTWRYLTDAERNNLIQAVSTEL